MRTILRTGKDGEVTAKCPYCGHPNILADEADVCDHLYEVGEEKGKVAFYFVKDYENDIHGKRLYNGKVY